MMVQVSSTLSNSSSRSLEQNPHLWINHVSGLFIPQLPSLLYLISSECSQCFTCYLLPTDTTPTYSLNFANHPEVLSILLNLFFIVFCRFQNSAKFCKFLNASQTTHTCSNVKKPTPIAFSTPPLPFPTTHTLSTSLERRNFSKSHNSHCSGHIFHIFNISDIV